MKHKLLISIFLIVISFSQATSQDLSFSQFYAAHLMINPALTGFSLGDIQAGAITRIHSYGFIPANTIGASCDMKLARSIFKPDILAAGLMVISDNIPSQMVSQLNILASGAYHKAFGNNNNNYLAFGTQLGLLQNQADPTKLSYDSQWQPIIGYNKSNDIGETFVKDQSYNFDLNMGLFGYSKINRNSAAYLGASVYHIHEPKVSYMGNDAHYSRRFIFHGGSRIGASDELSFIPNIIIMKQNKAHQVMEGFTVEYNIKDTYSSVRFGTWFRHSDKNLIFSVGCRLQTIQIGLSSDFISPLQKESRTSGAIELSVIYSPFTKKTAKLNPDPTRSF